MGGLALFVRFVFVLIVLRLVFRTAASLFRPREETPKVKPSAELVRDNVCNTFVPRDRALTAVVGGKAGVLLLAACRDRALLNASSAS